jgi:phospholipid/cholesterol/gamma-HCH transport system substrate-binding protein
MEKKKTIKVGIFVVLISIMTVWGFGFLRNKHFFSSGNMYYAVYDDIKGLTISGVVYMNGYKIGDVTDIKFADAVSGKIIVEIIIADEVRIPKGSVATISSLDIMGTRGIRIIRNPDTDKFLTSGDTLSSSVESDLSEQVNQQILPLKLKAEEMLSSFDSVLVAVRAVFNERTRYNIRQSFEHIQITLKNLQSASYSMDTIITGKQRKIKQIIDNAESITNNLEANNEQISVIIQNFSDISDSLARADIASTLNKTDKAVSSLSDILQKVENGEGSLGLLVQNDSLYNNLNQAAEDVNKLIEDIKRRPDRYLHFSAVRFGRPISEKNEEKELKKQEKNKEKDSLK